MIENGFLKCRLLNTPNTKMALVSIDLEPHEFGVMFDVKDECIVMEQPFAKLIELELRKEFKKHEVTYMGWADVC